MIRLDTYCLIPPPVLFIFSGRCYWLRIILYKLGLFCGCCVLSSLWVFFLLLLQIWSHTSVALLKFVYTNSTYTGIRSVIWHQLEPYYIIGSKGGFTFNSFSLTAFLNFEYRKNLWLLIWNQMIIHGYISTVYIWNCIGLKY